MLVVVDKEEKTYGILQLNRDTITEVPMLLQDGSTDAALHGTLVWKGQGCKLRQYGGDRIKNAWRSAY